MRTRMIVLAVAAVLTLSGCKYLDEANQANERLLAKIAEVEAAAQRERDAAAANGDAATVARLDAGLAVIAQARREAQAVKADGIANWAVGIVAPFIPPGPWRELLVWGGGLLGAAEVARRNRRGLTTLAASVVKLAGDDPRMAEAVKESADMLRTVQSPEARRAIDRAQV